MEKRERSLREEGWGIPLDRKPWQEWAAIVLVVTTLFCPGSSRTFHDAPPTRGLYWPTAYNLSRGETEIQFFAFASTTNPLAFFEFEYGLSDALQLGLRPVSALFGDVRLWGKVHVGTAGPISLAIPFGTQVLIPVPSWNLYGGWVLSWRVLPFLTLHPGIELAFVPAMEIRPSLGVDLGVGRNLKIIVEADSTPPRFRFGVLSWLFGFVRLQVDTPIPSVSLRVSVSGRF